MADIIDISDREFLKEHRRSWITFERVMLFAVLHVALALACLALAFLGEVKVLALLLFLGGTMAMIVAFGLRGTNANER